MNEPLTKRTAHIKRKMFVVCFFLLLVTTAVGNLGINYGQVGTDLPSPARSVELIKSIRAGSVKVYDANPAVLSVLANTNLDVSIMVPNNMIPSIGANQSTADIWVGSNIVPFVPATRIRYLLVGNEVLSDYSIRSSVWPLLVPAMIMLKRSLSTHGLVNIKVGTTLAMDTLAISFPPSAGAFRPDVARRVITPLLNFIQRTQSYFFLDVYPYFVWAAISDHIDLRYALLDPTGPTYTDRATRLTYTNMLDQQLDAVAFAMAWVGHPFVPIAVAETGWPNAGGTGANPGNATVYNANLVRKVVGGGGTPTRPWARMPVFVFSLFDENLKGGDEIERHWGVFYPNGTEVYSVNLTGRMTSRR